MKKLLGCFTLIIMLSAVTSAANATTLFEEDFAHSWTISANWSAEGGISSAIVTSALEKYTLNFMTNDASSKFISKATYNFTAGTTYTFDVFAYHTLMGDKYRDLTLAFVVGDTIIAETTSRVTYDTMPGYGNGDAVSLVFTADTDYNNVHLVVFLGELNISYGFESMSLTSSVTPAATPIPAAVFLMAPGLAGIAALRRKMN